MKLYDMPRSGNCYKIRLLLSLLNIPYELIEVDVKAGEHKTDTFLKLNPNGLLPVVVDGDTTVYDSAAILVYVAKKHGREDWLPNQALTLANITRWLAFEQSEGRFGLARARAMVLKMPSPLATMGTLQEAQSMGSAALAMLETQLMDHQWLAEAELPSIADIACYPYTALSNEGGLDPHEYPSVSRWIDQIESLPGYIELPRSI